MNEARIYQPAKTATQSGHAKSRIWLFEYVPETAKRVDNVMGWIGSGDMRGQIKLKFSSKEEAIAYAKRNKINFSIKDPNKRRHQRKSYSYNFRHDKIKD